MTNTSPHAASWMPSWDDIEEDSYHLAIQLQKKGTYDGIVAITRGGMIPACLVAQHLSLKIIDTIGIISYDHQTAIDLRVTKRPDLAGTGKGWVVIDDLSDSGRTFTTIRTVLPEAQFACLYVKPKGASQADTYVRLVQQDTWIHLPWEAETWSQKNRWR